MKLIVAGSRTFRDYETVKAAIDNLIGDGMKITAIIDGTARGVDQLASRYAAEQGIENIRIKADWRQYGKGAGARRNRKMAEMGDGLLALWDGKSLGTMNMIQTAKALGLTVTVVYISSTGNGEIVVAESAQGA